MADEKTTQAVDVEQVSVAKLVLPQSKNSAAIQNWLSLTPLFSVLITGMALVVSSGVQVYQNQTEAMLKVDSEWRSALEKIDMEGKSAVISALEMQSFLENSKHSEQARSLASAAIPNIDDKYEFDTAFFVVVRQTDDRNQADIAVIARSLTNQLGDLYAIWKSGHSQLAATPGHTLEDFVIDPEPFYSEQTESPEIKEALTKTWQLETTSSGLSNLWNPKDGRPRLQPKNLDLSGIIFLNNDFSSVDFREASFYQSEFLGSCKVNHAQLPASGKVLCTTRKS